MLRTLGYLFYAVDLRAERHQTLDDVPDYVGAVTPLFFILTLIEAALLTSYHKKEFAPLEAIASFATGIVQQTLDVALRATGLALYVAAYSHRFCTVPYDSLAGSLVLILGVDLGYYTFHRFSHEFHIGWIGHSVHHSGDAYNLATAIRQGAISSLVAPFAYLPLAFAGFSPAMYLTHRAFNLLYQFWIHTELVGSLGPLEYVLNTPSHHRVHHRPGANANYGGVLIVWDRLFGTFRPEAERRDHYGLGKPLGTLDPVYTQFAMLHRLAQSQDTASGVLRMLARRRLPPKWVVRPGALFEPVGATREWRLPPSGSAKLRGAPHGPAAYAYILLNFLLLAAAYLYFASTKKAMGDSARLASCAYLLLAGSSLGQLSDGSPLFWITESARSFATSAALYTLIGPGLSSTACAAVCAAPPMLWGALCALAPPAVKGGVHELK